MENIFSSHARQVIFLFFYLNCFFEFGAEILEDLEALVQFEDVSVLTEEINQSISFPLNLISTDPQILQSSSSTLRHTDTQSDITVAYMKHCI